MPTAFPAVSERTVLVFVQFNIRSSIQCLRTQGEEFNVSSYDRKLVSLDVVRIGHASGIQKITTFHATSNAMSVTSLLSRMWRLNDRLIHLSLYETPNEDHLVLVALSSKYRARTSMLTSLC